MQEWKASEKEAQKMTRDGAISVNLVTGEATHISDRSPEQEYSSADETAGALNRAADEVVGHRERRQTKKARRKRRDTFREGEAARDRPSSRLQFSEADRAALEQQLGKINWLPARAGFIAGITAPIEAGKILSGGIQPASAWPIFE